MFESGGALIHDSRVLEGQVGGGAGTGGTGAGGKRREDGERQSLEETEL